jgi:TonB-dependent starch-binding outer membrane protein SusC
MKRRLIAVALLIASVGGCSTRASKGSEEAGARPGVVTDSQWAGQAPARAEELLAGRFPGVEVYAAPGGGTIVRIRGNSTLYGDNQPLYVIDGQTIDAGPGGALMGINPLDIEKIEVLKDIGSTAAYGSRGANGVILIRTKRGPKQ